MALLQYIFCPLLPPTGFGSPEQSHSSPLWPPGGMASPPQPPSHSILGWCISVRPHFKPGLQAWLQVPGGKRKRRQSQEKKNVLYTEAHVERHSCTQLAISDHTCFFVFSSAHQHQHFLQGAGGVGARVELWAVQTYTRLCALRSRSDCSKKIPHKILARFEAMLSVIETLFTWSKAEL